MTLKPISAVRKDLDFAPRKVWPAPLPAMAWRGYLVAGFERTDGWVCDLADGDRSNLIDLLKACYGPLGLGEAARLRRNLRQVLGLSGVIEELNGWRPNPSLERLFEIVASWPKSTLDWIDQRQLGPRELSIFLSLESPKSLIPTLEEIVHRNLGRNLGVQILELSGELILLNTPLKNLPEAEMDPDGRLWLERLREMRQPMTVARDSVQSEKVKTLPWPKQVRAEWRRRGDKGLLEMRIEVESFSDYQRRLDELTRFGERLKEGTLWSN